MRLDNWRWVMVVRPAEDSQLSELISSSFCGFNQPKRRTCSSDSRTNSAPAAELCPGVVISGTSKRAWFMKRKTSEKNLKNFESIRAPQQKGTAFYLLAR